MQLTKIQKIGALIGVAALLFGGGYTATNLGSVAQSGEYHATTTGDMTAGAFHTLISNQSGVLGSVVVASSSAAGTLTLWNATSTTDTASTTIIVFPATPVAGTYTFDLNVTRGLIVEPGASFSGDYAVTFR